MFAALVLLYFDSDHEAKDVWLENVKSVGGHYFPANAEPGRALAAALRCPTPDECTLVSQSLPSETPVDGTEVMAYMRAYNRMPIRIAASPDGNPRDRRNKVRRAQ